MGNSIQVPVPVVQDVILDISKTYEHVRIGMRQGELNARVLRFFFVDDGVPIDLSGITLATLTAKNAEGNVVFDPCSVDVLKNVCEYSVTPEFTKKAGVLECSIKLTHSHYDSDGNLVGSVLVSPLFTAEIYEKAFDDSLIESATEFTQLQQMLLNEGTYQDMLKKAEDAGESAENAAEQAMTAAATAQETANSMLPITTNKLATDVTDAIEAAEEAGQEALGKFPVQAGDIGNEQVTTAKLASDAVTPEKTSFAIPCDYRSGNSGVGSFHIEDWETMMSNSVEIFPDRNYVLSSNDNYAVSAITIGSADTGYRQISLNDLPEITFLDYGGAQSAGRLIRTQTGDGILRVTFAMDIPVVVLWEVYSNAITMPLLVLAENTVTETSIQNSAVSSDKLASGSVTVSKLNSDVTDMLSEEMDTALRDAMYTVADAIANANGTYQANGIKFSVVDSEACVGIDGGVTANAGWSSLSLIIPAYIRIPSGVVYKVGRIAESALTCNSLTMQNEYTEARVYIPDTVTSYGVGCFDQYYGEAGGRLHIFYDGVTPSGYDSSTTTLYHRSDPFLLGDYYIKTETDELVNEAKEIAERAEQKADALEQVSAKRYGVRFDGSANSGDTVHRLYNAVGLVAGVGTDTDAAQNDFDNIYPWSDIRRCCGYWGDDGNFAVNAYKGEPGYAVDGSNGEVWVEIPLFYYKHTYTDGAEEIVISAFKLPGFMPSPMNRDQGTEDAPAAKAYYPAYPMALVDEKPTSRSGVFNEIYSLNTAMTDARKAGENYTVTTTAERYAICLLMLVEFATRNMQSVMQGAVSLPYSENEKATVAEEGVNRIIVSTATATKFVVGQTIGIGTSNGSTDIANNRIVTAIEDYDDSNKAICFDGDPVNVAIGNVVFTLAWINGSCDNVIASSGSPTSNTSGKYNCMYRGIERPYGDAFELISDVMCKREGTGTEEDPYKYSLYFLPNPTKYANGAITDDYIKLNYGVPGADGHVKTLGLDSRYPWIRVPDAIGASTTTYYSDYFTYPRGAARAPRVGGYWNSGQNAGPLYWYCYSSPSDSGGTSRARLSYHRS